MKLNNYSVFIIKPGFTSKKNKIKQILKENQIKIAIEENRVLTHNEVKNHYAVHKDKEFFKPLVRYMEYGIVESVSFDPRVCIMIVTSENPNENATDFITRTRKIVKEQIRPLIALKKEDFKDISNEEFKEICLTANGLHASDSPESAYAEIKNIFGDILEEQDMPTA